LGIPAVRVRQEKGVERLVLIHQLLSDPQFHLLQNGSKSLLPLQMKKDTSAYLY
jgi:hypothetical protein